MDDRLIQYIYKKSSAGKRPVAVMVALFNPGANTVAFGWSKYHERLEKEAKVPFVKRWGREIAFLRAATPGRRKLGVLNTKSNTFTPYPLTTKDGEAIVLNDWEPKLAVPDLIARNVARFADRAHRYFRTTFSNFDYSSG